MKRYIYIIMCAAAIAMTACDHDVHEGLNEAGVSFNLTWADPEDSLTEIEDLTQWIYDSEGNKIYSYSSSKQLSTRRYELAAGEYLTVTGINVLSPFALSGETASTTATKATATRAEDDATSLFISLSDPSASPAHAYYSCVRFTYSGSDIKIVEKQVNRVLAELSVVVEGAPEGAELSTKVLNAADGIYPARQDANGNYGVPSSGNLNVVTLKDATASGDTLTTDTMRLMPTVANNDYSYLHMTLTLPDGSVKDYDAECPKMYSSGKYVVTMKYEEMRPFMSLTAIRINDWTEGWVINGVVLDPD